jgi:2-desacetyl-2-hydroxyethyl bacteriochlorophyllide A dehydrogenase
MPPEAMTALVWEGPRDVRARQVEVPHAGPGESLLAPAFGGICGSDLHIYEGEHPRARPGAILGHEFVGTVRSPGGSFAPGSAVFVNPMLACGECAACLAGRTQACLRMRAIGVDRPGGLAELVAVPDEQLLALPAGIDLRRAALIEPLAVAVRAVRRSRVGAAMPTLVVGCGPVGLLTALCARAAGASVSVAEPAGERRRLATAVGFEVVDEPAASAAEVVFDAAGKASLAARLPGWVRPGGRLVVIAAYQPEPVPFPLLELMFRELEVIGSRVYRREDIEAAIEIVASESLPLDDLITSVVGIEEAPEAFDLLRSGAAMKILVEPGGAR